MSSLIVPCFAHAESLADALALAYQSNPTLQQARAEQRALDESSVQARTGWRPQLGLSASDDYEQIFQKPTTSINTGGATLNITQPLYTSGKTAATVRSADAGVAAGRENLRATEATVLLSVIQAYEDVLRDQTVLQIRQDDVAALNRVLDEVNAKRQVGQITRTDVLQIQTQLATAQSALSAAEAQLQNSRAEYAGAVGQNPGSLTPPPTLPEIPKDVDAAFDAAEADNPSLRAAKYTEQSSREKIAQARAGLGPSVAVGAQVGYSGSTTPAQTADYSRALSAQVTLTQPLFTGGLNTSLIRQAIEQNAADRIGVERARRLVVQGVAQAWNQSISIARMKTSDQTAYDSAKLELEGMQEEYKVALRSTLEVLSADEALRGAELNLATADHDEYLSQANLLGEIGRLEAAHIVNGPPIYDPKTNFNRVKNRGALPYEGLIAGIDTISIGHVFGLKPIETPAPALGPVAIPPGAAPGPDSPLVTNSPTLTPSAAVTASIAKPAPLPKAVGPAPAAVVAKTQGVQAPMAEAPPPVTPSPSSPPMGVLNASTAEPPPFIEVNPVPDASEVKVHAGANASANTSPTLASPTLASPTGRPSRPARLASARPSSPSQAAHPDQQAGRGSVQAGAFSSLAAAEQSWVELKAMLPTQVQGKFKIISPVQKEGATFYRIVVGGFDHTGEAKSFCDAMKAKGRACFVKAA